MPNEISSFEPEVVEEPTLLSQIGIMSDSHGKPAKIISALDLFKAGNCRPIFHLGDICDSTHPETAEDCTRPL